MARSSSGPCSVDRRPDVEAYADGRYVRLTRRAVRWTDRRLWGVDGQRLINVLASSLLLVETPVQLLRRGLMGQRGTGSSTRWYCFLTRVRACVDSDVSGVADLFDWSGLDGRRGSSWSCVIGCERVDDHGGVREVGEELVGVVRPKVDACVVCGLFSFEWGLARTAPHRRRHLARTTLTTAHPNTPVPTQMRRAS